MLNDNIIIILHSIILYFIIISPLIDNYELKRLVFFFLIFISIHFFTKYGKCGLINIERLFLKDNFKNGFLFKLIKPLICYKRNIFYKKYFEIILIYIFILYYQLNEAKINLNIFNECKIVYNDIIKKFEK